MLININDEILINQDNILFVHKTTTEEYGFEEGESKPLLVIKLQDKKSIVLKFAKDNEQSINIVYDQLTRNYTSIKTEAKIEVW